MSLYGMVFGKDATAGIWVDDVLNATDAPDGYSLGRFRDAWLERVDGGYRIAVYTRNGGGNRQCWGEKPPCNGDGCPGCAMTNASKHPRYLHDQDDTFDCTYATLYFRPSETLKLILAKVDPNAVQGPVDTDERWLKVLERLKNG